MQFVFIYDEVNVFPLACFPRFLGGRYTPPITSWEASRSCTTMELPTALSVMTLRECSQSCIGYPTCLRWALLPSLTESLTSLCLGMPFLLWDRRWSTPTGTQQYLPTQCSGILPGDARVQTLAFCLQSIHSDFWYNSLTPVETYFYFVEFCLLLLWSPIPAVLRSYSWLYPQGLLLTGLMTPYMHARQMSCLLYPHSGPEHVLFWLFVPDCFLKSGQSTYLTTLKTYSFERNHSWQDQGTRCSFWELTLGFHMQSICSSLFNYLSIQIFFLKISPGFCL